MYCSHFGLHRPPFNNTPDPTFYFSTPDHEEALATLHYATIERKGFVLVTGEVGAGKTLTARVFLRQIEQEAETAVITNTHLSGRQLLAAVCSEFDLNPPPDASNLELSQLLQEFLLEQFARDRYVVVVIDEAQNLADEAFEELRMLGNLEADDAKLLQVCILGQPELRNRFSQVNMRQLDQRLFRRFHLKALSAQQTREYIRHRLQVAGCPSEDLFTSSALSAIYRASKGIPRLINQICDSALLAAYSDGLETVSADVIDEVCEREKPRASASSEAGTRPETGESLRLVSSDLPEEGPAPSAPVGAVPAAKTTTSPAAAVKALNTLARSIQECVEAVVEADERKATEPPGPGSPESEDASSPRQEPTRFADRLEETPWDMGEITKRCQKARDELSRLAQADWSAEPPPRPHDTEDGSPPEDLEAQHKRTAGDAKPSPTRGRIGEFVDAVRQKCSRRSDGRTSAPRQAGARGDSRPAEVRRSGSDRPVADDLSGRLRSQEQAIAELKAYVTSELEAATNRLQELQKQATSAEDLDKLKSAHESAMAQMEQKLTEHTAALKQLSDSIEQKVKAASGDAQPEFQALSQHVIEQAQQLQELRKRMLDQHTLVAQSLSDMQSRSAGRAELETVRAEHSRISREMLEKIERNRDDVQMILDDLEDRCLGLRDRIEAVVSGKADAAELAAVRERQDQEFGRLLGELGRQRQEMEQRLEQAVAEWKRTQQSLDDLAAKAADKRELDGIRQRQAEDAARILQMLVAHRGEVERLAKDLERRSNDLLKRLNALPKGIATTEQLAAIRSAYTEQITDLTARLAVCENGFEKARDRHERGLRAVAGKALDTARRVSILEERGRPRRIRLELTPQVGIELGDTVAAAQERHESLKGEIEQARQTAGDLRQITSSVGEAIQKWREDMDASWAKAEALFGEWQSQAREAKAGADRMLDGWRAGATEIREEAGQLRASAKIAAEILQKMRQCHGVIEARLNSNEWHAEVSRADALAERLERAVAAGQTICQQVALRIEQAVTAGKTICQQISSRTEQSKQELAAYLADCRKQLAERLAQFAIEQKHMDQVIENRRQMLANIARSAGSLAEVIDAGRRFDEQRQPLTEAREPLADPRKPVKGESLKGQVSPTRSVPPPIESREPTADTLEQIQWPRLRTHQAQAI